MGVGGPVDADLLTKLFQIFKFLPDFHRYFTVTKKPPGYGGVDHSRGFQRGGVAREKPRLYHNLYYVKVPRTYLQILRLTGERR